MCSVCTVVLHITVNNIQTMNVAQRLWQICVTGYNKTYLCLHVSCPIFFSEFKQIRSFSLKVLDIKSHGNPSTGNHAVKCGQLTGAYQDYANMPKVKLPK